MHDTGRWFPLAVLFLVVLGTTDADAQLRRCGKGQFWDRATGSCKAEKKARKQSPESRYRAASKKLDSKRPRVRDRAVKTLERNCQSGHFRSCTLLGFLYRNGRAVKASARTALDRYQQACTGKDAQGCLGAARLYEDGLLGKPDHKKANVFLANACNLDHAQSCYRFADKHEQALGVPSGTKYSDRRRRRRAQTFYAKAVKLLTPMCPRDGNACYLLGKAHRDGKGVTRGNASMAFRFFDNGCKARSADACQQLASAYKSGRGTLKDIKKGNEVLERTCNELDSPQSCTDVGLAMTKLPKSARQPERIKAVAERACALEKKSCWLKGYIYDQGFAGRTDQRVATQYYEMSCTDGYGEACRAVGFRYKNGTGVPKNRKKAMVFWKRGCEIGNGQSCLVLARKMEIGGTYGTRNPRMAVYYAIGACQKKVKEGCQMAGARIRDNKHGVANVKPAQSRSLFFEGCRLGHSISCNALAKLHLEGKLIPRNPRKAVQNFEKACDLNHSSACQTLAELYSSGREAGIAKNPIQAARAYARACYAGYGSACFKIDTIVKEQKPDRIVRDQLRRKLERACRKPVMKACEALGLAYVQGGGLAKKDERGAFDMFKKSCERNKKSNGWACNSLGQMYANGVGTRKDVEVAKGLFREQCDLRNQFGCYQLAVQLFYQKSYGEAMGLFKQTCEDKHADSCNFVGYMMFHGKGTQWDAAGAIPFYEKACELGEAVGCSNVAELHFWGIGRAVDYEKAYELYKQTCDKSGNYGCTYVGRFHQKGLGVVPVDLDLADQAYAKVCAEPLDWTKAQACLWQAEVARERGQKSETEIARMRTRARGLVEERAKEDGGYGKYLLGLVYRDGVATVANPKRAAELFGESCEDNSVMGCFTAGEFYLAGAKGLEPDRRKAESYFERACAAGMSRACEGAKEARKPPPVAKQPEVPLKPADRNPGCACDSAGLPTQSGLWALLVGIGLLFSRRREKRRARARASRR